MDVTIKDTSFAGAKISQDNERSKKKRKKAKSGYQKQKAKNLTLHRLKNNEQM